MTIFSAYFRRSAAFVRHLANHRRGNVLMIMGFAVVPLTLASGIAIDYADAARLQTKLNAAADAAALAGVSRPMMAQSDTAAQTVVKNTFNSLAANIPGLVSVSLNPDPPSVAPTPGARNSRTVTVTYTAQSKNFFSGFLGMSTVTIGGTSVASATAAPNIDFYVLMDTSPSMALPTTTTGFNTLYAQTGCAFACHQNAATTSDTTVYNGTRMDYYTFAKLKSIPLRVDEQLNAVKSLADTATTYASQQNTTYRMSISTFDKDWANITALTSDLSAAKTGAGSAQLYVPYKNNYDKNNVYDNDTQTNFTKAFTGMLGIMPLLSGGGTNSTGDTPQAFLFIITDGMRDELRANGNPEGAISTTACDTVKARKIKIAILYTEYLKDSLNATDSGTKNWVDQHARPIIDPTDKLAVALESCASSGLYYKVTSDQDITYALKQLFDRAVAQAHLTQ